MASYTFPPFRPERLSNTRRKEYSEGMDLELSKIQHIGNTLRRQVHEEFPDLTVHFIFYDPGNADHALEARKADFVGHPAGKAAYEGLKAQTAAEKTPPEYAGLHADRERKLVKIMAKKQSLACFFVNFKNHDTPEDLKQHCTALVWHGLRDHLELTASKNRHETKSTDQKSLVSAENKTLFENMLADAFSTVVLELQGQTGAIKKLARRRSQDSLSAQTKLPPELYPFLLCYEALQIVYNDMVDAHRNQMKPMHLARQIVAEIALSHDAGTMQQWSGFCAAAQEMASMGADKHKILSAAIYTSEDPYLRSAAHIVSDALNIEPLYQDTLNIFNAFADPEVNQRAHGKLCEQIFQDVAASAFKAGESWAFIKEASRQNRDFLNGRCLGWCAYALVRAADVFETSRFKTRDALQDAREVFQQACQETPWKSVREFYQTLMAAKKSGQEITMQKIVEVAVSDPSLFAFAHGFSISEEPPAEEEKPADEKEKTARPKTGSF